jgi:hypothetical protein
MDDEWVCRSGQAVIGSPPVITKGGCCAGGGGWLVSAVGDAGFEIGECCSIAR